MVLRRKQNAGGRCCSVIHRVKADELVQLQCMCARAKRRWSAAGNALATVRMHEVYAHAPTYTHTRPPPDRIKACHRRHDASIQALVAADPVMEPHQRIGIGADSLQAAARQRTLDTGGEHECRSGGCGAIGGCAAARCGVEACCELRRAAEQRIRAQQARDPLHSRQEVRCGGCEAGHREGV